MDVDSVRDAHLGNDDVTKVDPTFKGAGLEYRTWFFQKLVLNKLFWESRKCVTSSKYFLSLCIFPSLSLCLCLCLSISLCISLSSWLYVVCSVSFCQSLHSKQFASPLKDRTSKRASIEFPMLSKLNRRGFIQTRGARRPGRWQPLQSGKFILVTKTSDLRIDTLNILSFRPFLFGIKLTFLIISTNGYSMKLKLHSFWG